MSIVDEYIALTDEIKELTEKRRKLGLGLDVGRHSGTEMDVRVSIDEVAKVQVGLLRLYVTKDVINMCTKPYKSRKVVVVDKLKRTK